MDEWTKEGASVDAGLAWPYNPTLGNNTSQRANWEGPRDLSHSLRYSHIILPLGPLGPLEVNLALELCII